MDGFMQDNQVISETPVNAFPGLTEGDYRVYVTNDYGCLDTTAFTIEALSAIQANFSQPVSSGCLDDEDAGVSLGFVFLDWRDRGVDHHSCWTKMERHWWRKT